MLSMEDNMLSVGIDISKDKVDIAVYDGDRYVTNVFDNSVKGVNRMLAFVTKNIKSFGRASNTSNRRKVSKQKGSAKGKALGRRKGIELKGNKTKPNSKTEAGNRTELRNKVTTVYGKRLNGESHNNHDGQCTGDQTTVSMNETQIPLEKKLCFVMEATGTYYLTYAYTLYDKEYTVYVINPLIIKRYGEEKLRRAKTDKADAKLISEYGYYNIMSRAVRSRAVRTAESIEDKEAGTNNNDETNGNNKTVNNSNGNKTNSNSFPLEKYLFKPNSSVSIKIKLMLKTIDQLYILKNRSRNHIEALNQYKEEYSKESIKVLNSLNKAIDKKILKIEKKIEKLITNSSEYRDIYKRVTDIPGIGKRTGSALIGWFDTFNRFNSAKQVAAYIGLNPSIKQSGKSINNGSRSISRIGNPYLRKLFYMDALSASRSNAQCKSLYERLLIKGKDKPQILTAVGHKLLRQAFAIIKYNRVYDPEYCIKE